MKFKTIKGLLFAGCIIFLSTCGPKDQPNPDQTQITDSCTSIPGANNGAIINSLDQPYFSIDSGSVKWGTKVNLLADTVFSAEIFEISTDSGKVWKPASCITLLTSGQIWGRRRYKKVFSPVVKATYSVYYERVIIFGNSITGHGPAPEVGWKGDWGMAASNAQKDYVHIISNKLRALNPKVEIMVVQAVDFEQSYWKYDFTRLQKYTDFQPDLVIMRIAENTDLDHIVDYESSYDKFISQIIAKTTAKVICTSSFWSSHIQASYRIFSVARNRGYVFADLGPYSADKSYTAYKSFSDTGVGKHPSDKGMQAIADCISSYF